MLDGQSVAIHNDLLDDQPDNFLSLNNFQVGLVWPLAAQAKGNQCPTVMRKKFAGDRLL
jgi:hypothetical protein